MKLIHAIDRSSFLFLAFALILLVGSSQAATPESLLLSQHDIAQLSLHDAQQFQELFNTAIQRSRSTIQSYEDGLAALKALEDAWHCCIATCRNPQSNPGRTVDYQKTKYLLMNALADFELHQQSSLAFAHALDEAVIPRQWDSAICAEQAQKIHAACRLAIYKSLIDALPLTREQLYAGFDQLCTMAQTWHERGLMDMLAHFSAAAAYNEYIRLDRAYVQGSTSCFAAWLHLHSTMFLLRRAIEDARITFYLPYQHLVNSTLESGQ